MQERDWRRLVEQVRYGDCTPFLGAGASAGTLPTGAQLSREWARQVDYPFADATNLAEVMQFANILERDAITVKERLSRQLSSLGEPHYENPAEAHSLLARQPITVYLTTNYDDFMTRALLREGKQPVTAVCPWHRDLRRDVPAVPADYLPSVDKPLVYHLFGSLNLPASMVLTEQDHVTFLATLARELGASDRRMVPPPVLTALTHRPLLFLGFSLWDWSFRLLFHGLISNLSEVQRRRHVSVQLGRQPPNSDPKDRQRAEQYLGEYYEQLNVSVFWGSAAEFCAELDGRLKAT